jgi:bacteriorhodopsin
MADFTYTAGQYDIIYNFLSLVIAAMGSSTLFFLFQVPQVQSRFKTALIITALVTFIACYHYLRIFNSFTEAYVSINGVVTPSGIPFNDAYRYVDWLLTVPLLLMELILVMDLPPAVTVKQCLKLGSAAALMVILGYPGEISDNNTTRWIFWALAMVPFIFIVYSLFVGLRDSVETQPAEVRGLVSSARLVTVISWCVYPLVFMFPMFGLDGASSHAAIQVGYSIADVIAKPGMGLLCWAIARRKSTTEEEKSLLDRNGGV